MSHTNPHDVTQLLGALSAGDPGAAERLVPLIYAELHAIAERNMRHERPGHTLQPTALVSEAFMRLVGQDGIAWQSRAHFLGLAAQVMRRILVDHARRRHADKRGGGAQRVTLEPDIAGNPEPPVDLESLDEALVRLAALDARQAKIVELRFFAGLSVEETAEVLQVSATTVKRDWAFAKAWLHTELSPLS